MRGREGMGSNVTFAAALVIAGALYIRLRWRRSPRAYWAMIVLSTGYSPPAVARDHPRIPRLARRRGTDSHFISKT
jgi:hypothetical protein